MKKKTQKITNAVTTRIADELCYCGRKKSEHDGPLHHGGLAASGCERFTWKMFLDKDGKRV